jgi:hypothetical protein
VILILKILCPMKNIDTAKTPYVMIANVVTTKCGERDNPILMMWSKET